MSKTRLACLCLLMLIPLTASAADLSALADRGPGAATEIDFGPLLEILGPLFLAAITSGIGAGAAYLRQHTKNAVLQQMITNVQKAADAAAGLAYKYAASHTGGLTNVAVHDGALAVGSSYVLSTVVDSVNKLGLTPDQISKMVEARLGALLASDPSVSVGNPPPATTQETPHA